MGIRSIHINEDGKMIDFGFSPIKPAYDFSPLNV